MTPIDSDSRHPRSGAILKNGSVFALPRYRMGYSNIPCIGRWWNTRVAFNRLYREGSFNFRKRTSPDRWYGTRESASPGNKPKK